MKILAASILFGSLMLIGAPPAVAGQSVVSDATIQMAANDASQTDRDTYTHKARNDTQEWRRKLDDFGKRAKAEGRKDGDAANRDLDEAWNKTRAESDRLATASADGWENAKASFEKASQDLADTWHRVDGESK